MIKIYGTTGCPSCKQAVSLCKSKELEYLYIDMMEDPKTMDALVSFIGNFRSVPQILVDEVHVGGFEGLVKHLNKGE